MKIIKNEWAYSGRVIIPIEDKKVLVGHRDGSISSLECDSPSGRRDKYKLKYLACLQRDLDEIFAIVYLLHTFGTNFISINSKFRVRFWDSESEITSYFDPVEPTSHINSAVLLPNNMLAIAGSEKDHSDQDMRFWIWDIGLDFPATENASLVECHEIWRAPNWHRLLKDF
ncbi:hypothetical protein QAD02_005448 [Eretmocerus hayati]|uniref:Uncharacterized protein n=1 Tax=Eretmocerus hayati TaxID=131215 RepID=A0ACC2NU94_9HYME|nr:hypothetical protein QAD02_005448 [Eretmocerus hayati]